MVVSSATGRKLTLYKVGKSKKLQCFSLCDEIPPMAYNHLANAWLDKAITVKRINTVIWPWHFEYHGFLLIIMWLLPCL